MRLLLALDNHVQAERLARSLRQGGYAVDQVADGGDVCHLLTTEDYDVVLLGLFLRGLDGFEVLQRARSVAVATPIAVLSASVDSAFRVKALQFGADDIIANSLDLEELDARIKALIRRARGQSVRHIRCGALCYDVGERSFLLHGQPFDLPAKEHALLEALVNRQGKTVRKEVLFEQLYNLETTTSQATIEVYIHRLRRRLSGLGARIVTLRGQGYRLEKEAEAVISSNEAALLATAEAATWALPALSTAAYVAAEGLAL